MFGRSVFGRRVTGAALAVAAVAWGLTVVPGAAAQDGAPRGDHAMGSQIVKHEGTGATGYTLQSTGDDPASGVQGIDVSRWQGYVDWQYWWDKGKRFAYVKATEGTYNINPYYDQQYNGAAEVGMYRGAYHFAIPDDSDAITQANFFVDNGGSWTAADNRSLPGVLDLEYNPNGIDSCYGMTKTQMVDWITAFIDTYRARVGRNPVIYTSTNWWDACVGSTAFGAVSPLWIVRWSTEVGTLPAGWPAWTFWQYGIAENVDQDKFSGTLQELDAFARGVPGAPRSVRARGHVGKAELTWTEPSWPGVDGVTKYQITVSPGGRVIDDLASSARAWVVDGLANGTTYSLEIRAYSSYGRSRPVARKLIGTKISSAVSRSRITYSKTTTFSGRVYREDSGAGRSGWSVVLQERKQGSTTWRSVQTTETASDGRFSFTAKPSSTVQYRAVFGSGGELYMGSESANRWVGVRQLVGGGFNDSDVRRGTTVRFSGKVAPRHSGQTVHLQVYADSGWKTVKSMALNSESRYGFAVSRGTPGTYKYRVYRPEHHDHLAGWTPARALVVR